MHHPVRLTAGIVIAALIAVLPGCKPATETPHRPAAPPPAAPQGFASVEEAMKAVMDKKVPMVDTSIDIPADVVETKDIEYGRVGDRPLLLDLYMPVSPPNPVPVLIFIHGGGWYKGDRSDYKYYTVRYAKQGYAAATISYRLSDEAKFPAAVEDAKCAVRWVRANASTYGFESNFIAVIGGSAGGHLAMMAGYTAGDPALEGAGGHTEWSSKVAAVVNFYGPSDLRTDTARTASEVTRFLGQTYEENQEVFAQASPITHIDGDCPPTLIFHGSIDQLVPVEQSEILASRLQAAGVPCDLHVLEGWPHTMDAAQAVNDYCRYYLDAFLEKYVPRPMQ